MMTQSEPGAASGAMIWVLASPGAGDNAQLRTMAEVLGGDLRWFDGVDSLGRVVADRMIGARWTGTRFEPPWPDLVLIAGGRHVVNAMRIRAASGGRTRVVCIGRPWAPLAWFDLVVTTPQYRLPEDENVLTLDLPLNRPPGSNPASRQRWLPSLEQLPRPVLGVLLGGDSGSFRIRGRDERRIVRHIDRVASAANAGVAIVDSPRTPPGLAERLAGKLGTTAVACIPGAGDPNPYAVVLQQSDALLVTEDSVSMIADAIATGKPTAVLNVSERLHTRLSRWLRRRLPGLARPGTALVRRGLWSPPRDVRTLSRHLVDRGLLIHRDALLEHRSETLETVEPFEESRARIEARVGTLLAGVR